jgi:hypothetical protein
MSAKMFSPLGWSAAAAAAAVVGLLACSALAAKPVAPPEPPPPPPVALAVPVLQSAAAYAAYMDKVGSMKPEFHSGADVAQSLSFSNGYDPQRLLRGEIAYGAVAALQDPAFVAAVRIYAADPGSREQIAQAILRDPAYVAGFKGADSAAGLVEAALLAQGAKLIAVGGAVKQSAYDIQHQAWSKEAVLNREGRLLAAKNNTGGAMETTSDDVSRLQQAASGATPLPISGVAAAPPYTPVVLRGMAVAALAILGEAGDERTELMEPLFAESSSAACLNMAKLNLYQCLAVSRPHYEDVFCLGQHVLMDTGQCVTESAGGAALPLTILSTPADSKPYVTAPASKKKRHSKS